MLLLVPRKCAKKIHSMVFPGAEMRLTVPEVSRQSFWLRFNIYISLVTRDLPQASWPFITMHKYIDIAEIM